MIERLVALALLVASGVYLANALPLPLGTTARPGAGFFPVAVGVFGIAVVLAWVVSALRRAPAAAGAVELAAEGRGRVLVTATLLVGFCVLLPWAGFPLVSFLFVGLLLHWLGGRWTAAVAIALVSAVGSYYLFVGLLGVPLPRGVLFD
jgi:putative tricarboxylic transport membrane protein